MVYGDPLPIEVLGGCMDFFGDGVVQRETTRQHIDLLGNPLISRHVEPLDSWFAHVYERLLSLTRRYNVSVGVDSPLTGFFRWLPLKPPFTPICRVS